MKPSLARDYDPLLVASMTDGIKNVTLGIARFGGASLTVSAGMARGLVDFAVQLGADRARLLADARLPSAALSDEDSRIAFDRYVALYAAAEHHCSDPAFALHLGEWIDGMDLLACHVGSASATLGDALVSINRYGRLALDLETIGGGDPFPVERGEDGVWLIDASIYPGNAPQITETSFVRLIAGARQLDDQPFARAVHFVRSEPLHRAEYERVFRAPVHFAQRRNALLMDPSWFSLPLPATATYAATVLKAHAGRLMEALAPVQRRRPSVSELVTKRLGSGNLKISSVARELGMSRQTLYRALRAEGTTFHQIADQVRRDLAMRLLEDGRSVKQTAELLGFSAEARSRVPSSVSVGQG